MATSTEHFREYETIYVLRNDVDADGADRIASRVGEVVEREKGKLVKFEAWGRRKLAYPVGKQRKGVYVYVKYLGKGGLVQELERNLRLSDVVIKHLTVQTADDVDVEKVTIDPEEIKFRRLELAPEAEEQISREKMLGLVPGEREEMRERREEDEYAREEEPAEAPEAEADAGDKGDKGDKTEKGEEN
jgi:small subunit ribosomal protein S6